MKPLKVTEPWFDEHELAAVAQVLASGQLVQAGGVREFEQMFAKEVGGAYAVMVSSGTAALHLALLACGVGPGDAVAVPDFSFVATANAVALTGATPLFVDVEPDTYNIEVSALRHVVERARAGERSGGPRLKVVMPVHQFGLPAEMDALAAICREYGLGLVEDAACALGSRYRDAGIAPRGLASCFSFHPRKVITTGEGGAVVTHEPELADRLRALRAHGFAAQPGPPVLVAKGLNYRMTEMQAALGMCQMQKLPEILRRRRWLADLMHHHLESLPWFARPVVPPHLTPNWQSYVGVLSASVDRAGLIARLAERGIEARPGATAIHLLGAYRAASPYAEDCPVSTMLDARAVALPLHCGMNEADVMRVATELRRYGSG